MEEDVVGGHPLHEVNPLVTKVAHITGLGGDTKCADWASLGWSVCTRLHGHMKVT